MQDPAFPVSYGGTQHTGMTLREWYAGMALMGLLGSKWEPPQAAAAVNEEQKIALRAFRLADAMIAARERSA